MITPSMYEFLVPTANRMLGNLSALLDKAAAHVETKKLDPTNLVTACLAPDMYPLTRQVQIACDQAKGGTARLSSDKVPSYPDVETTIPELKAHIAKTLEFVNSIDPVAFAGSEGRQITLKSPTRELQFTGLDYLRDSVLPNLYFHVTTAYVLLRHNGVGIGRLDFLDHPRGSLHSGHCPIDPKDRLYAASGRAGCRRQGRGIPPLRRICRNRVRSRRGGRRCISLSGLHIPFLGIRFYVIVALFFAVHVVRNNQNMYQLFILFAFPLLGSVVYFFAIYLPEIRHSRSARVASRAVTQLIGPNRAVREAHSDFDRAPTVQHRLRLGEALSNAGSTKETHQYFEQAATGPFTGDPVVLLGLARAQLATGDAALAKCTLDKLFKAHRATRQQPDPTLLYARALTATNTPNTCEAFEQALTCASDAAVCCLFGEWLLAMNNDADKQRAQALFEEILHDTKH